MSKIYSLWWHSRYHGANLEKRQACSVDVELSCLTCSSAIILSWQPLTRLGVGQAEISVKKGFSWLFFFLSEKNWYINQLPKEITFKPVLLIFTKYFYLKMPNLWNIKPKCILNRDNVLELIPNSLFLFKTLKVEDNVFQVQKSISFLKLEEFY